jgi:signal transduction histidine kinase
MRRLLGGARARILAAFVLLLMVSEGVAVVAERQILLSRAGERVDDSLAQEVEEFRRLVRSGNNPLTGEPFGTDVRSIFDVFLLRNVPGEGEAVFTFLGGRLHGSTDVSTGSEALDARLAALGRTRTVQRGDVETTRGTVRYLAVPVRVPRASGGVFVVTTDLGREEAEINEATQTSAGVALAVLALASLIAFVVAGRVLSPLRELTDTARGISETDLTRRIDARGNDEIAELARTFNGMLDRLEGAFASQRAFVSDAGHELRTPITIIRGHLELLGEDPDERRDTVALVTDELDRMSRFVDDLLVLAKAERSDFLRPEELDLDVLTEELMAKASGLAPRAWTLDGVGAGVLTGDRQRLTQAVMNLAHNAVQHTADGDVIALGSRMADGSAELWVRDTGPGVAPADRDRIFERFARGRGGPRRSDGAGLGLAIVRAIGEAHGGRVELDTRPGDGATFRLVIPTHPPTTEEPP